MKSDYHIHYYLDSCADKEMTLENIDRKAYETGLTDITVVKHYSYCMPNGKEHWACWHAVVPEQFNHFIEEINGYKSKYGLNILSGVETELINEDGDINIPEEDMKKIDMVTLSVHYMASLKKLPMFLMYYPPHVKPENKDTILAEWREAVKQVGAESIIEGLSNAYRNAILRHPKVRVLAHMYDGFYPLRAYEIDVDSVPEKRILEIMEPMMKTAAENNVLWELTKPDTNRIILPVLKRAAELGVKFTATADSHFIEGGWANIGEHDLTEQYIVDLGLPRGHII